VGKTNPEQKKGTGKKKACCLTLFSRYRAHRTLRGTWGEPPDQMEKQVFGKKERVRRRKDYLNIYKRGRRIHSDNFTVILSPNPSGEKRLGIAVSKKVGNAVKRNRIKRLLREFFRLNKDQLPDSKDMVIIAKKDVSPLKYRDVCLELADIFKKKQRPCEF
jgi:ribonuclease P protein component